VFTNLLLADEINRAPAKVQSALLEVMQEYQVTIAGVSHLVPQPFLVMATQNPIETEGTYPLPEAQVDRFMMKVLVGYPSEAEETVIVNRVTGAPASISAVASTEQLSQLQGECRKGYVDPALVQYAVRLVSATRNPDRYGIPNTSKYITYGASPRATIHLVEGARALAYLRNRSYVLPQDMIDILFRGPTAEGEAQRPVHLLRLDAERQEHVARLEFLRRAGRAGGGLDALGVEEHEDGLAFHRVEAYVHVVRKALGAVAVEMGLRDGGEDAGNQLVAQRREPRIFSSPFLLAETRRFGKADDGGHVLGAGPEASFVAAAVEEGFEFHSPAHVKERGALGPIDLLRGSGEEVDPHLFHIQG
jgi:hypothetical protein